ncbi:hypothetical protein [Virgisporangium aliadipatigenens]|nr:hypothetical protein [Virgisporangium aliadipatigenens]
MTTVNRGVGVLLLTSLTAMIAGAAVAVPSGLTLNPSDLGATLGAVHDRVALHLVELALDVLGWLALTAAGLLVTGRPAGGLLAAAGLAGLLHDAGNLAVTQLTGEPAAALAVLLLAKWTVNLAGLLWVAATAFARPGWGGLAACVSGAAAVVLPWTSGLAGPGPAVEQLGYALHLPIMIWWGGYGVKALAGRSDVGDGGRHDVLTGPLG